MVSPSVKELLGYAPQKMIGQKVQRYFKTTGNNEELLEQLFENKSVRNYEGSVVTKDGEELRLIINVRLIQRKGNIFELEGVARDITQLKKANEELQKSQGISRTLFEK